VNHHRASLRIVNLCRYGKLTFRGSIFWGLDQSRSGKDNPDSIFEIIVREKPDRYIFGGDGPYADEGKTWTKLIDKYGLKPIINIRKGIMMTNRAKMNQ